MAPKIDRCVRRDRDGNINGIAYVVGDRQAALLDAHLKDGLIQILQQNEKRLWQVRPVPFLIRFQVLYTFLTELRKKHSADISRVKMENAAILQKILTVGIASIASKDQIDQTVPEELAGIDATLDSGFGGETETKALPWFFVYTQLNERSLVALVNAGRGLDEVVKSKFGSAASPSNFNISPLYFPRDYRDPKNKNSGGKDVKENAYELNVLEEVSKNAEDTAAKYRIKERRETNLQFKLQMREELQNHSSMEMGKKSLEQTKARLRRVVVVDVPKSWGRGPK